MIDTHAHIYTKEFNGDLDKVIQECQAQGIDKILMPNIDQSSITSLLAVEKAFPRVCFPMMGSTSFFGGRRF